MARKKTIRILTGIALSAAVLYGMDLLSLIIGVPARPRYSTVTINRFFYINEKFSKFSYEPAGSAEEKCANSLFPQLGSRPCWYVRRHHIETINVN